MCKCESISKQLEWSVGTHRLLGCFATYVILVVTVVPPLHNPTHVMLELEKDPSHVILFEVVKLSVPRITPALFANAGVCKTPNSTTLEPRATTNSVSRFVSASSQRARENGHKGDAATTLYPPASSLLPARKHPIPFSANRCPRSLSTTTPLAKTATPQPLLTPATHPPLFRKCSSHVLPAPQAPLAPHRPHERHPGPTGATEAPRGPHTPHGCHGGPHGCHARPMGASHAAKAGERLRWTAGG